MTPNLPIYLPNAVSTKFIALPVLCGSAISITSAVNVHSNMVSTKTSKTPRQPCAWGLSLFEDACAVGDVPQPASFDKTPLDTPYRIDAEIPKPTKPPLALSIENASLKIISKVGTTKLKFPKIITKHKITYVRLKNGISAEVILLILSTPPSVATKARTAKAIPKIKGEQGRRDETALICTKLPVVSEFSMQKTANIKERKRAAFSPRLPFKPSLM